MRYGADQTVYLLVERFSGGSVYRETEIERTDLETIISDFMAGQLNDPVRVVAFNTLERWADHATKDVAQEVQTWCDKIASERRRRYPLVDTKALSISAG